MPDAGTRQTTNTALAVPLPPGVSVAIRRTTVVAVTVVAAVAAVVSFAHMHDLAVKAGEGWRAWLLPLAVDGLIIAASMTMLVRRRQGQRGGTLAWCSLILGIAASLAANVAAAAPTWEGRIVAAWPPIALLLAYELLMQQVRDTRKT
jgi:peptidoglycan/LPS O-acetylase OafA/YrhL